MTEDEMWVDINTECECGCTEAFHTVYEDGRPARCERCGERNHHFTPAKATSEWKGVGRCPTG